MKQIILTNMIVKCTAAQLHFAR